MVHAACQDAGIQRWLPDLPRPYSHADAHAFVTDALGLGPHQFAITEHGEVVGSVGLRVGRHQTGHVGYWCASESRGRGIMTRALRRVCRYALEEVGVERLDLTTDVENLASQRVAEKVGFRREGWCDHTCATRTGTGGTPSLLPAPRGAALTTTCGLLHLVVRARSGVASPTAVGATAPPQPEQEPEL